VPKNKKGRKGTGLPPAQAGEEGASPERKGQIVPKKKYARDLGKNKEKEKHRLEQRRKMLPHQKKEMAKKKRSRYKKGRETVFPPVFGPETRLAAPSERPIARF